MAPILAKDASEFRLYRGLPGALQDLQYRPGSLEVVLFWNAPRNRQGMDGWRVFQDNEANLIEQLGDRNARQITIKMAGNASSVFYVCAVSAFGREGPKRGVLARTNSDVIVTAGTAGSTGGIPSTPDPEWQKQPSGGAYQGRTPNVL